MDKASFLLPEFLFFLSSSHPSRTLLLQWSPLSHLQRLSLLSHPCQQFSIFKCHSFPLPYLTSYSPFWSSQDFLKMPLLSPPIHSFKLNYLKSLSGYCLICCGLWYSNILLLYYLLIIALSSIQTTMFKCLSIALFLTITCELLESTNLVLQFFFTVISTIVLYT